MEQREKPEKNTDEVIGSSQEAVGDSSGNERLNVEAATPRKSGRGQLSLGRVVARLQAAGKALREPARNTQTASEPPIPKSTEEVSDEIAQDDALNANVTRWVRRLLIPLAILAWAGVGIPILWAAGYVARTILLLVIALLLAYALSPFVTLLERMVPRFLAILLVYLIVLGGIGTLLYFIVRTTVDQIVSLSN